MDPQLQEALRSSSKDDELECVLRLGDPTVVPTEVRVIARFGPIVTGRVVAGDIGRLYSRPNVLSLKAARAIRPGEVLVAKSDPQDARLSSHQADSFPIRGEGVVVAALDWGLDFAHPSFLDESGRTRLHGLWDQRGSTRPTDDNPWGYGRIFSRDEINRALAQPDPYRALGYYPALGASSGRGAHGTHVLSIAAGTPLRGRAHVGIAPGAELVFVHLSSQGTSGLAGLGDSVRLLEGLDFVRRTSGDRKWVCNLSLGRTSGDHTGTSLVEQAMDFILEEAPGRAIAQSAGNYFGHRTHAAGVLHPGGTDELGWQVEQGDTTANELEIFYPRRDNLSVSLVSPAGHKTGPVRTDRNAEILESGVTVGHVYNRGRDPNSGDNHLDCFLYPNAPSGRWRVLLDGTDIVDGRFDAYIERDASARLQSKFAPADVEPSSTLGTIANGYRTFVCGAYEQWLEHRPVAEFSSSGPTRDGRIKPDILAPGVAVLGARSTTIAEQPGLARLTRMSGTSMAAPHVAGTVAALFSIIPRKLPVSETRALLLGTLDPADTDDLDRSGRGYLNISAALAAGHRVASEQPALQEENMSLGLIERLSRRLKPSGPQGRHRACPCATSSTSERLDPQSLLDHCAARVLGQAGDKVQEPLELGDALVREVPGLPALAHVAVLSGDALRPDSEFSHREHAGPGLYGAVIEEGAFPHDPVDQYGRKFLEQDRTVPRNQMLVRFHADAVEEEVESEENSSSGAEEVERIIRERTQSFREQLNRALRSAPSGIAKRAANAQIERYEGNVSEVVSFFEKFDLWLRRDVSRKTRLTELFADHRHSRRSSLEKQKQILAALKGGPARFFLWFVDYELIFHHSEVHGVFRAQNITTSPHRFEHRVAPPKTLFEANPRFIRFVFEGLETKRLAGFLGEHAHTIWARLMLALHELRYHQSVPTTECLGTHESSSEITLGALRRSSARLYATDVARFHRELVGAAEEELEWWKNRCEVFGEERLRMYWRKILEREPENSLLCKPWSAVFVSSTLR